MPETRDRLQARLADIEQALKEARSADVRELLDDLRAACRRDLDELSEPVLAGTAADAPPQRPSAG